MTQKEIQSALQQQRDGNVSYLSVKRLEGSEDVHIDANRNGILNFCYLLLESIDKEHLAKNYTYDFPDAFWDESDVMISVEIKEGNRNRVEEKESVVMQAGCFLGIALAVVVFIVGTVTSVQWLSGILE